MYLSVWVYTEEGCFKAEDDGDTNIFFVLYEQHLINDFQFVKIVALAI